MPGEERESESGVKRTRKKKRRKERGEQWLVISAVLRWEGLERSVLWKKKEEMFGRGGEVVDLGMDGSENRT